MRRRSADVVLAAVGEPWKLGLLLAALFALLAFRAATLPVDDPDVWWIAAAGRDAIATLAAPETNAYSYTAPNHPWIMHEIAFGVLYACGLGALGASFFPLLTVVVAAAMVFLAAATILRQATSPMSAALALLLVLVGCREGLFAPRPSHTAILFPIAMAAIALRPGWTLLRTLAVTALEILWANAHGSFPLGVAIVAASAFADAGDYRNRRLVAAAIVALATLVNPYGLRLHGLVEGYVLGNDPASRLVHEHIIEFSPIWRVGAAYVNPFNVAGLVILSALAASALRAQRHSARALLSLFMIALAAYQVRHLTLAVAVGAVLLHPEIDDLCAAQGFGGRAVPRWLAGAIVVPGLCAATLSWSASRFARTDVDWIAPATGGASLVRLVTALPPQTRAYLPFESGGLAIWLGSARGIRVFFDSRNDCYPPKIAEAAFALEREQSPQWVEEALERYDTDVALVPETHPVYRALRSSRAWHAAESDAEWVAFRR